MKNPFEAILSGIFNRNGFIGHAVHKAFGYHVANSGWDHHDEAEILSEKRKKELLDSTAMETPRNTLRTAGKLFAMYWTKAGAHEIAIAATLAAATLGFACLNVDILLEFNAWKGDFMDILQGSGGVSIEERDAIISTILEQYPNLDQSDPDEFSKKLGTAAFNLPGGKETIERLFDTITNDFSIIVGKYAASTLLFFTASQHLNLRWRTWMTGKFTNEWLRDKAFYKIKTSYDKLDNPDQRIQEDFKKATDAITELMTDGLQSVLTLIGFAPLLYSFGSFNPAIMGGPDITIGGYALVAAFAYAAFGTGVLGMMIRHLPGINRQTQRAEANYRAGLISVHENAEQVALGNGEECEKIILKEKFTSVVDVSKQYINKMKKLKVWNSLHGSFGYVAPYVACIPLYSTGLITFGGVMKVADAFRRVESSFSFIMNNMEKLTNLKANFDRLGGLMAGIELAHAEAYEQRQALNKTPDQNENTPPPPPPAMK